MTHDLTCILDLEIPLHPERERHEDEDCELPDDILRRSHPDFHTRVSIEPHITHTSDRRADDIHDTEGETSFLLYHLQAFADISRLS